MSLHILFHSILHICIYITHTYSPHTDLSNSRYPITSLPPPLHYNLSLSLSLSPLPHHPIPSPPVPISPQRQNYNSPFLANSTFLSISPRTHPPLLAHNILPSPSSTLSSVAGHAQGQ